METRMPTLVGPLLVLVFAVTQALRDVYFGNVFQGVNFFAIILLTFVLSTIIFGVVAWLRSREDFAKLRGHVASVIFANLTTALAWSCYFFGLTHLDPSVVNTIHSAMGPLTVVVLGWFGIRLAQMPKVGWIENLSYAGITASVVGLWWVVLSGQSGLEIGNTRDTVLGLALLAVSGASITISLLYCKRLQDAGIGAATVTAVRYLAIVVLAAGVAFWNGGLGGIDTIGQGAMLSVAAVLLIVLPLYALQVGIGRIAPLLSQIIRALGPIFVFALAQFDGRLHYAMPVLVCIVIYSVSVLVSNFARGWREEKSVAGQKAASLGASK
jgi:drug/metabolite transporter (DMT)-like permease